VARLDEAQAQLMEEIKIIKEIQSIYETLKESRTASMDEFIKNAFMYVKEKKVKKDINRLETSTHCDHCRRHTG